MDMIILLKGMFVGFIVAAPIGPIGILCIRRSMTLGFKEGFATGLGAAIADAFYGSLAAFGLQAVWAALATYEYVLRIFGSLLIGYIGLKTFFAPSIQSCTAGRRRSFLSTSIQTMLLTLTNPLTIIAFAALLTTVGLSPSNHSISSAILLSLGIFIGSALWFLFVSAGLSLLARYATPAWFNIINKLSGILLFGVAIWILFEPAILSFFNTRTTGIN